MPYQSTREIPDYVPAEYRRQWMDIFNNSYQKAIADGKDKAAAEEIAFRNASGVIKDEKSDGKTVKTHSDGLTEKKTLDTDDNVRYTKISTGHTMESPQVTLEDLISPEKIKESQRKAVLQALREELKLDEKSDFKKEEVLASETKSEEGGDAPSSDYLVVEDPKHPTTWHLPVKKHGKPDHGLMGAAKAALTSPGGHRGNKYEGPDKEKAISKLKSLYHSEGMKWDDSEKASEQLSDEQTQRMFWLLSDLTPTSLNGKKVVEIPICIAGTWVKGNHKFSITSDDIDNMIRNFETRANGQTVIDYEHASEMPELAKGNAIPAAGWMHGLRKRKIHDPRTNELVDALTALAEWTPKAEEMLLNGEYRFFSPAIDWSKTDKKTGKPIGAALTSGALTNHPFLEELPPITLSDHIVLSEKEHVEATNVEGVHVPAAVGEVSEDTKEELSDKEKKMSKKSRKKLKLEKIASGDKAGKYGVFDADNDDLLHAFSSKLSEAIETMNDFEKSEILADFDPDNDGDNDASKKGDTDKDFAGKKEKASDVEAVAEKTDKTLEVKAVEEPKKSEAQLLSECIRVPKTEAGTEEYGKAGFDMDQVAKLTEEGALNVRAMLTASKVANEVEKLVTEGKILPKQKASMFRIALNDPEGFADFVAQAKPVVDLGVKGIQGGEKELQKKLGDSSDATQVFMAKVNELKAKNQCSYEQALRDASHQYTKEYGDYIQQTLRLSEKPNPELTPTVMLTSRS